MSHERILPMLVYNRIVAMTHEVPCRQHKHVRDDREDQYLA
jgi:hypothetical protein